MSESAVLYWEFTLHGAENQEEDLCEFLQTICKDYVFQEEQGAETKRLHFQGHLCLETRRRLAAFKKLWPDKFKQVHLSPTVKTVVDDLRTGVLTLAKLYAAKEDTRVRGPWSYKLEGANDHYVQKRLRSIEWRPWQQKWIDLINAEIMEGNDRTCNVLVDETGNQGKSIVAKWFNQTGNGHRFPPIRSYEDLSKAVASKFIQKRVREPRVVFFDVPRSVGKKSDLSGVLSVIESVKDGELVDYRYEFKEWIFEPPVVWCTTNSMIDLAGLSSDRWAIWRIEGDDIVRKS